MLDELYPLLYNLPLFPMQVGLVAAYFFSTGALASMLIGSRKMFVFAPAPILVGVVIGWFPFYFLFISFIVATLIAFIPFPPHISYKDRINMVEAEMRIKHLADRIK